MGYECPVCGEPQADAEHLANHLAFSALLGRDDHEAWLDDHAPDWAGMGPDDLAPVVADHVPEVDLPGDEDAGEGGHGHGFEDELARRGGYGRDAGVPGGRGGGLDPDTRRILEEARAMTEEMYGNGEDGDDGDGGGDGDGDDGE